MYNKCVDKDARAVDRYRKRRKKRLKEQTEDRYDAVEEYRKRRAKRLGYRVDDDWEENDHPRDENGRFTSGGGGSSSAKAKSEKVESERKVSKKSSKTSGGVKLPSIKSDASYDKNVSFIIDGKRKKFQEAGREKDFDRVMSSITDKDVTYQKNVNGKTVANIPGLAQKFDDKMVGRSEECQKIYDEKIAKGKVITGDLQSIVGENGYSLHGLEYCYKEGSSTAGKIDRKRSKDRDKILEKYSTGDIDDVDNELAKIDKKPDEDYLRNFGDVVRYTVMSRTDDTVDAVNSTIDGLKKKGYEIVEVDNKWLPKGDKPSEYKAVHVGVISPSGETFEIQFHSPETMHVKDENHLMYEVQRNVNTTREEKMRLGEKMMKNTASLSEPKNITNLKSYKKG